MSRKNTIPGIIVLVLLISFGIWAIHSIRTSTVEDESDEFRGYPVTICAELSNESLKNKKLSFLYREGTVGLSAISMSFESDPRYDNHHCAEVTIPAHTPGQVVFVRLVPRGLQSDQIVKIWVMRHYEDQILVINAKKHEEIDAYDFNIICLEGDIPTLKLPTAI